MKLLTYKFLLILTYFLSTAILLADTTNIKNLVIHNETKKIENVIFRDKNKKIVDLKDFYGDLVILNFWATWCAPCREEMPSLDKLQNIKDFKNLKIIPINVGQENIEKSVKFFSDLEIKNLDLYFDNSIRLAKTFSLRGLPTTVFINKNGEEFARIVGSIDFNNNDLLKWLLKYD
tara:strand:+ start:755 stop:1282 length:528 start_codon:yes stop_codon:yes gene_type:complete